MLESSCVARGTAAFSVRLDIRSGHPAENSTELRINGDSTPHGQNWLRRKTSLSWLGASRNGDAGSENTPCLSTGGATASGRGDSPPLLVSMVLRPSVSCRTAREGFVPAHRWGWGVTVHPQRFSLCRFGSCTRRTFASVARPKTKTACCTLCRPATRHGAQPLRGGGRGPVQPRAVCPHPMPTGSVR